MEKEQFTGQMKYSRSRWDYPGYGREFVTRNDANPGFLKRYAGIIASQKEIDEVLDQCHVSYIVTGGHGYAKHSKVYDVFKMRELLKK